MPADFCCPCMFMLGKGSPASACCSLVCGQTFGMGTLKKAATTRPSPSRRRRSKFEGSLGLGKVSHPVVLRVYDPKQHALKQHAVVGVRIRFAEVLATTC